MSSLMLRLLCWRHFNYVKKTLKTWQSRIPTLKLKDSRSIFEQLARTSLRRSPWKSWASSRPRPPGPGPSARSHSWRHFFEDGHEGRLTRIKLFNVKRDKTSKNAFLCLLRRPNDQQLTQYIHKRNKTNLSLTHTHTTKQHTLSLLLKRTHTLTLSLWLTQAQPHTLCTLALKSSIAAAAAAMDLSSHKTKKERKKRFVATSKRLFQDRALNNRSLWRDFFDLFQRIQWLRVNSEWRQRDHIWIK